MTTKCATSSSNKISRDKLIRQVSALEAEVKVLQGRNNSLVNYLDKFPLMHDAQTTMKKYLADGGVAYDFNDPVIINRDTVSNLYADLQVLKLSAASDAETKRGFDAMKEDADAIALFLREAFAREIDLGHHANRSLGAIVTGYLRDYVRLRDKERLNLIGIYSPSFPGGESS